MILKLLRVKQYVKNLFIFLPSIFAGILSVEASINLLSAFILFSMIASSVYILNDIVDINEDKLHPVKKRRAIASGMISLRNAKVLAMSMALVAISGLFLINIKAGLVAVAYVAINVSYTFILKHMAIYDVVAVASGFVVRILIGGFVAGVYVSPWLATIVFSSTLFLAIAKRRSDVISYQNGIVTRKVAAAYSENIINSIMIIMAATTIVSYVIYSVEKSSEFHPVYISSFFVIIGILKYIQMSFLRECGDDPAVDAIKNKHLILLVFLWGITIILTTFKGIQL